MPTNVQTPERRSTPAGSLTATATVTTGDMAVDEIRWRNPPAPGQTLYSLCASDDKTAEAGTVEHANGAWLVQAVECDTPVAQLPIVGEEANRLLEISTSALLEQLLLTGGPDADDTDGSYLSGPGVVDLTGTGSPIDVVPAMMELVEAIDGALYGGRGYIHVPRYVVPILEFYGQIVRFQQELQLAGTDHRIVAGAGYDGTGPEGAEPEAGAVWVYATGHPHVHQGPITTPGLDSEGGGTIIPFFDPATNEAVVIAERPAAVSFDTAAHFALEMCVPNPGPGCGS